MARLGFALFSTLFGTCLLVSCLASPTSRILNGGDATPEEFPCMVSLRRDNAHVCGATIISPQHILTAAHCVSEIGTTPVAINRVSIRTGSTNQYAGGKIYNVAEILINPGYGSNLNDLAILRLSSSLVLGPRVQVIALADSEEDVKPGDSVTTPGWGATAPGEAYSVKLRHSSAVAISSDQCEQSIGYGYPSVMCLQSAPGEGACSGDGGGPAMFDGKLVGVSNIVIGTCGTRFPDVYAKVASFKLWISSVINGQ